MNKLILTSLLCVTFFYSNYGYNGSSMAPVVLSGAVIKSSGVEIVKKYKRQDCPVCKGKGQYLSGDGIKMVDCGYCEEDKRGVSMNDEPNKKSPFCRCVDCKCENCQCKPKNVIVTPK